MWSPEWAAGSASLLRVPLADFGDGSRKAPASQYRALPTETGGTFHNRFVSDFLLYGSGSGWGRPVADGSILYVVPWSGGAIPPPPPPPTPARTETQGVGAVRGGRAGADA